MVSLDREKRGQFNMLRSVSHLEADLALLKTIDKRHPLISAPSGKDQKYADDVLYALLGLTANCDIVAFRRQFAKEKFQKAQAETLRERFARYIAKVDIEKAIDIKHLIDEISKGLLLFIAALDWPIDEDIFPGEIELVLVEGDKFNIQLTAEAITTRETAAKLKKEQEEAERKRLEADAAEKLRKEQEDAERKKLEAETAAKALKEKEAVLDEKESELSDKEEGLEDKEADLDEKESELAEKAAELAVKEADLENKATIEKKSVSKKKSTPK
ncbi:hypothetical protein [Dysgonomonas termitidis]|uniref:Uncharacterized protein n=1 Tax=Dysgonomonas termitidis TaxID=1516126 RepID=A0ABV9KQN0_9BACT